MPDTEKQEAWKPMHVFYVLVLLFLLSSFPEDIDSAELATVKITYLSSNNLGSAVETSKISADVDTDDTLYTGKFKTGSKPNVDHIRLQVAPEDESNLIVHFTIKSQDNSEGFCDRSLLPSEHGTGSTLETDGQRMLSFREPVMGICYWELSKQNPVNQKCIVAQSVGCVEFEETSQAWHFFAVKLRRLDSKLAYAYKIGLLSDGVPQLINHEELPKRYLRPAPERETIGIVGDLGTSGISKVAQALAEQAPNFTTFVHLGDASYNSNRGGCYGQDRSNNPMCEFDCPETSECDGRKKRNDKRGLNNWESFFKLMSPLQATVPFATTTGNHDNDLVWFFKYRPAIEIEEEISKGHGQIYEEKVRRMMSMSSEPAQKQQALLNSIGSFPYFYSYNRARTHFISLGTEDNFINPYEMNHNNGLIKPRYRDRFESHYGANSSQYKWLIRDLEAVNRSETPMIIVFTHRPMWHSSSHHPSCSSGGDWYGCEFRSLYSKAFEKFKVNFILGGHAHHYQRSKPMIQGKPVDRNAPRYIICGTGGFKLDHPFNQQRNPDFVAFRQSIQYGYCQVRFINNTHVLWQHVGVSNSPSEILDEAVISLV